jgi:hypothetical protein
LCWGERESKRKRAVVVEFEEEGRETVTPNISELRAERKKEESHRDIAAVFGDGLLVLLTLDFRE